MYRVEMNKIKFTTDSAHLIEFAKGVESWIPKSNSYINKNSVVMENWLFNKTKYLLEGNTEYTYVGD